MTDLFAIITGAASGIGRATAVRLGREGYALALLDRDEVGLSETLACLKGIDATTTVLDLRNGDVIDAQVQEIVADQAPTALVNVAGVGLARSVLDTTPDEWSFVIDINLTAVYRMCRAVLPAMIAAEGGVIVNVASVGGLIGLKERAAYCASKAGVVGLTKAIAVDHATQGIRAIAMCPGTVQTEWIDKILAEAPDPLSAKKAMEGRQLDGRMGSPQEIAGGIAFLLGPDGRFVNGSEMIMDGGVMAQ